LSVTQTADLKLPSVALDARDEGGLLARIRQLLG
jgi:hypothetical protein